MKYFTKYLPVEGEIKEGDTYKVLEGIAKGEIRKAPGDRDPDLRKYVEKVKLFLCSRDIQVSDKVYRNKYNEEPCTVGEFVIGKEGGKTGFYSVESPKQEGSLAGIKGLGNWGKVIGEISPDAIWVKEGDEFERLDWEFKDALEDNENPTYKIIQIKCSNCKTFH